MKRASCRSCTGSPARTFSNGFPGRGMPAVRELPARGTLGDERLSPEPTFWMTMGMIDRDPRGGMEQMDHVIEEARKYR